MALIKSIAGIRGTIGGVQGEGLTPQDIVLFTASYSTWLKENFSGLDKLKVVVGRDARISGEMVKNLVYGSLMGMGIDVIDLGLSTTPTVEMAVTILQANGGIILTASHNPKQWNALKLLNSKGEFISQSDGNRILELVFNASFNFATVDQLGKCSSLHDFTKEHIRRIVALPLVDVEAIRKCNFKIAVDAVNSSGGIIIPELLKALGVNDIVEVNCEPHGNFAHNPEPLPENLKDLSNAVIESHAHLGFAVDPDVDRLAIVSETGEMFGEEYTLVAVSDYVLMNKGGNTVSNLSSTRALRDVTENHGFHYFASAVGEVNVVEMMKSQNAVIGGEGNGGIIYPELHYGRDALVGIALFLTHLAKSGKTCSALRSQYPDYFISKNKIELNENINPDEILKQLKIKYKDQPINTIDGVKIEFGKEWVHLRKSNTEPIIRIYAESQNADSANLLAKRIIADILDVAYNVSTNHQITK